MTRTRIPSTNTRDRELWWPRVYVRLDDGAESEVAWLRNAMVGDNPAHVFEQAEALIGVPVIAHVMSPWATGRPVTRVVIVHQTCRYEDVADIGPD